jgi:hypothetical protein
MNVELWVRTLQKPDTEAQDSVYAQEVSDQENRKMQETLTKPGIDSDIV